jgi:hypothetical protein
MESNLIPISFATTYRSRCDGGQDGVVNDGGLGGIGTNLLLDFICCWT